MFGILFEDLLSLRPFGFGVPPVWNEAAISLNPVACGFIGAAGGGARPADTCDVG